MRFAIAMCGIVACTPLPQQSPEIASFTARPIGGVGALRHALRWDADGDACTVAFGDGTPPVALPCSAGGIEHDYARGDFTATLVADGSASARARVLAPANPPIVGATPVVEVRGLVDVVRDMAWSPDGALLATNGAADDRALVFGADGRLVASLVGLHGPTPLSWSGGRLAVGGRLDPLHEAGAVDVWDVAASTLVQRVLTPRAPGAVALAGQHVAIAVGDELTVRDVASTAIVATLTGLLGEIRGLAFSPDGSALAGASSNGLFVWNADGSERWHAAFAASIESLAWNPQGTRVAIGTDARAIVCDVGVTCRRGPAHTTPHLRVAWRPDGNALASASTAADRRILVWDPATGALVDTLADRGAAALAWSSSGALAYATSHPDIRVVGTDAPLATRIPPTTAALDPSAPRFAMADRDGRIHLRDAATGADLAAFAPAVRDPRRISFSADGGLLALTYDEGVAVHRTSDWAQVATLPAQAPRDDAAFSPDATRVAVPGEDGRVLVYTPAGALQRTIALERPTSTSTGVHAVAWSADGTRIAADVAAGVSLVAADGSVATTLDAVAGPLAFSPDGRLAYMRAPGVVAGAGDPLAFSATRLAWSPLGGKLALGGTAIEIRDLVWGGATPLGGARFSTTNISWSSDARTVVTTAAEGRIVVWRLDYE